MTRVLLLLGSGILLPGCMLFEQPVERAAPSALGWLTNWNSQPLASTKVFDLETIKPDAKRVRLVPESYLEITVWDLYEPGRPHTFPVRVSNRQTIEVPLVGEYSVAEHGATEVEAALAEEFRRRDLLKTPRVLVRSLDSGHVRVQVTGAVLRPGFVDLSRGQASVYDAVVAAGGLKGMAGNQISVTCKSGEPFSVVQAGALKTVLRGQSADVDEDLVPILKRATSERQRSSSRISSGPRITPGGAAKRSPESTRHPVDDDDLGLSPKNVAAPLKQLDTAAAPNLQANRIEERTVPLPPAKPAQPPTHVPSPPLSQTRESSPREGLRKSASGKTSLPKSPSVNMTRWFDVSIEADRQFLKNLTLSEGDFLLVKSADPPIRIAGSVNRPGDYALPADRVVDLWQALELAGGIKSSGTPLNIALLRPPGDGHGPQRWQWQIETAETRPRDVPKVHAGDVINIEPPAASRIRTAMGGLWSK